MKVLTPQSGIACQYHAVSQDIGLDLYTADSLQTERTSLKAPNGSTTDLSNLGPDVEQTYGNGHIFNICSISAPWGTSGGGIVAEVKDASMKPLDGKALCPSVLGLFAGGTHRVL